MRIILHDELRLHGPEFDLSHQDLKDRASPKLATVQVTRLVDSLSVDSPGMIIWTCIHTTKSSHYTVNIPASYASQAQWKRQNEQQKGLSHVVTTDYYQHGYHNVLAGAYLRTMGTNVKWFIILAYWTPGWLTSGHYTYPSSDNCLES